MQPLPTPAAAEALIRRHVQPLPVESRPLAALAGAVLAQSVRAERDQPRGAGDRLLPLVEFGQRAVDRLGQRADLDVVGGVVEAPGLAGGDPA